MFSQRLAYIPIFQLIKPAPAHDHHIDTAQLRLLGTETLPHKAFDAVSVYSERHRLARKRQTQTRESQRIRHRQHGHEAIAAS